MRWQPTGRTRATSRRSFPVVAYREDDLANSSVPSCLALNPLMQPPMPISMLELSLADVLCEMLVVNPFPTVVAASGV
jgi:hypothetical protein